ncbi:hypothetical protein QBC38DRAFT_247364 [Podospora fimiseda]|uniref:Uncharacterized protein n=1 Tax=Podospora fimiseda TaxID=252190 RepID=A0AAN7BXV1_9PEZI|nr:hypothetical protein QBC38DRAFT_247364 [Podospora fimiseda]
MTATLHPHPPIPPQTIPPQTYIVPCQAIRGQHIQQQSKPPPAAPQKAIPNNPSPFNPAHCHPVFFTDKLRRPPFTMGTGPQLNPVAHGYVYQDAPPRSNGRLSGSRL